MHPMTTDPEPEPEETEALPERREEEDATRGPGHERPDEVREDVGLDEPRRSRPG
jgi:hypothetical protein